MCLEQNILSGICYGGTETHCVNKQATKMNPPLFLEYLFFKYFLSFGVFSAILEKSLEKSALSSQLTGGEGGTNRENYPAAPDTQEVGLSRLRMKQALIFLPPPAATVQLCGVYDTKHCIGCSAMVPLPAQSSLVPAGIPCHCFKLTVLYSCADPGFCHTEILLLHHQLPFPLLFVTNSR